MDWVKAAKIQVNSYFAASTLHKYVESTQNNHLRKCVDSPTAFACLILPEKFSFRKFVSSAPKEFFK